VGSHVANRLICPYKLFWQKKQNLQMLYNTEKRKQRDRALRLIRQGVTMSETSRALRESYQLIRYWVLVAGINPKVMRRRRAKRLLRNGR